MKMKTGTTTVGIRARDCVVLAADMRASMGHIPIDEESEKVHEITDNVAITEAGSVGDSMMIIRFLRSHARLYEINREEKMTGKAAATFLANVLNANRYYPFWVQMLVGGYVNEPELFEVEPFGGLIEMKKYAVTGSGSEPALTTLDLNYRKDLAEADAVELAVKAIESGKRRDVFSGGKGVSVMVVDRNGLRRIPEAQLSKLIVKVTPSN
ncbi:MAG: proteasome subunit beta [Candidatus Diapherotrites archaeon]|nr:proteasome subunit beta [Candidatus Diapherotrites archaeon]